MKKATENVLISSAGIKNSLKRYKPLQALAEYVWNGFDAGASRVDINIYENEIEGVESISIADNGTGIDRSQLSHKFQPFFQSEKIYEPNIKHSATHGRNGVGRLTFFTFANSAKWETVYEKDNQSFSYDIEISSIELQNYTPSDETIVSANCGTKVTFSDIISSEITSDTAYLHLAKEFCWFLELNKDRDYAIYINGNKLDYTNLVQTSDVVSYIYNKTNTFFSVRYVCWNVKLSEYSKYYYIQSNGVELAKENTTLNNKGDRFYHSVYIQSDLFDNFDIDADDLPQLTVGGVSHKKTPEYQFIMEKVNHHLYDLRRPFILETVSKVVEDLEIESAFPSFNKSNPVDQYRKSQIEKMVSAIYVAQPKIFTGSMNKEQKKTFVRLLDLIMESGEVDALFTILDEILDMTEDERRDLSDILKYTKLSNITKTIKLIKDRYKAVEDLKQLVFNPDLHANEVNHLQHLVENHYWLFGEQYNLVTAAEPNFVEALKRYQNYLHEDYKNATVDHPDKLKQMDIFAVRQDVANKKYQNIVVELKHPHISLGETQLSQVKKYMRVILSIDRFNADNMYWEFYLIGNKFSSDGFIKGELETNKVHGEPHLVYKATNYKIYVVRWSEIFADFEMRYAYLNDKLCLERDRLQKKYSTADEVVEAQKNSTAVMPGEMTLS